MIASSFATWLSALVPQTEVAITPTIFVILNTATGQNPMLEWTKQDWATNSIPLYYQTSMESILKYSPWLVEVNADKVTFISEWMAEQPDPAWGWCYTSTHDWLSQVDHWRQYLRVNIEGKLSVIRFQDPRLIELWLEQKPETLWQNLLATAHQLYLPNGTMGVTPSNGSLINTQFPWSLPLSYIEAWHNSSYGIKVRASNLDLQIWERSSTHAETIFQTHGDLATKLEFWLKQRIQQGENTMFTTLDMAFDALTDKKELPVHG
ncbi:MAG: DUF4123 domain-containing protein [Shewanella sp.]|nr:DUF4123 domain-containing protein [Shewanella sp.]